MDLWLGKPNNRKEQQEKMNYAKLRGRIKEIFGTEGKFAEAMSMDKARISARLNNKVEWSRTEIENASLLLEIPFPEVSTYFFCEESWEMPTNDEGKA